jgi:hypothetical protein
LALTKVDIIKATRLAKNASIVCSLTMTILLDSLNGMRTSTSILDKLENIVALINRDMSKI